MEIKDMTINDIEARAKEIREAMKAEDADLDALTAEVDALEVRKAEIRAEVEARAKEAEQVAKGLVGKTKEKHEEKNKMTYEEMRKSAAYMDAYAHYIKTGHADKCRALMAKIEERDAGDPLTTQNVDGQIPVPADVEARVRTAWERDGIMSRISKTYFKGNHKVFWEVSGSDAHDHEEGSGPVDAEELVLGTLEMIPKYAKKWLPVSDEVYSLTSEKFLFYVYDELTYRIIKKIAKRLLDDITTNANTPGAGRPVVPKITAAGIDLSVISEALANLSEDAAEPAIMMNKKTWGAFEAARAEANYNFDPYYGLPVIFKNELPAFQDAVNGDTIIIVGDIREGGLANFPNGEDIEFKFDDTTEMTSDIIRILGKLFVAVNVVAPNAFCVVQKQIS